MLQTIDNPASDRHQAVLGIAELAPGASSGKHRHYGVELAYVLEGTVVVEHDGRPTATLKAGDTLIADEFQEATILFADIVGYTELAGRLGPAALVCLLNEVFSRFDRVCADRGAEKIKTLFQQSRIPVWERRHWPVLMDGASIVCRSLSAASLRMA